MPRDFWYSYIQRKPGVFTSKTPPHPLTGFLAPSHAAAAWPTPSEQQATKRGQLGSQQRRHPPCLSDRAWGEREKRKGRGWVGEKRKWMRKGREGHPGTLNRWLGPLLGPISFRVVPALAPLSSRFEQIMVSSMELFLVQRAGHHSAGDINNVYNVGKSSGLWDKTEPGLGNTIDL